MAPGSQWRWFHPTDDVDPASVDPDFHTTFFSPDYDDSAWQTGPDSPGPEGGFGYGDPVGVEFDPPDERHRKTAYFRHRFTTAQGFGKLILSLQLDDGMIVYLDGQEVGRLNVTDAPESYDLHAPRGHRGTERWFGFHQLAGKLEPGEHVLAISVHNHAGSGKDDL